MKEIGTHGIIGVHVLEPAMQICAHAIGLLVETGHAQAHHLTLDHVNVSYQGI